MNAKIIERRAKARLNRIRRVARFFKWICILLMVVVIGAAAIAILMPNMISPEGGWNPPGGIHLWIKSAILQEQFKPEWHWLYYVMWIILPGFYCWGVRLFYRLFANLERGIIFSRNNVRLIRLFGWWLVTIGLIGVPIQCSKVIWMVHDSDFSLTMDFSDIVGYLLVGIFAIFVAWIMDEGRKIQEEQELTV